MTPILGFAPDADLTTPGVLADCRNLIPTLVGMSGGPTAVTPNGVPALAGPCQGAAVISKLNGDRRILAGTKDAIYELLAGVWTDVSDAGGYNGGVVSQWSVAQFGDATLMANRSDAIQRSVSGAFAVIPGAPKAEIVFSVGAHVMALNVNDGTEKPDGWHCSAVFDDTDWVQSVTTQSASGRLVSAPGPILAGARLGEYAVAYKARAVYIGQYVGAPVVWDWTQVSGGDAGCVGKKAICDVDGIHFFVGEDNFWLFDGTRPVPIADGTLRDWFKVNSNPSFLFLTECVYDRASNQVWIFYPSTGSQSLDATLVYHIKAKKWGRANRAIQTALEYVSPSVTIDGLPAFSGTIDGLPDIGFDSQFWRAGGRSLSVFDSSNQLVSLSGQSDTSGMETGDAGDDDRVILLQGLRLRYAKAPASASVQTSHKMNSGEAYSNGVYGVMNDGKFDTLKAARWHRAVVNFTGPVTVTHINPRYKAQGTR